MNQVHTRKECSLEPSPKLNAPIQFGVFCLWGVVLIIYLYGVVGEVVVEALHPFFHLFSSSI